MTFTAEEVQQISQGIHTKVTEMKKEQIAASKRERDPNRGVDEFIERNASQLTTDRIESNPEEKYWDDEYEKAEGDMLNDESTYQKCTELMQEYYENYITN